MFVEVSEKNIPKQMEARSRKAKGIPREVVGEAGKQGASA
jgi:hypothetical protein